MQKKRMSTIDEQKAVDELKKAKDEGAEGSMKEAKSGKEVANSSKGKRSKQSKKSGGKDHASKEEKSIKDKLGSDFQIQLETKTESESRFLTSPEVKRNSVRGITDPETEQINVESND